MCIRDRLGEALAVRDAAALELLVGVEEAVGRHELHVRRLGPACEHVAQDAGGGRLAHGHGARDAHDERRGAVVGPLQKAAGATVHLARGDRVLVDQATQGAVDVADLGEIEGLAEPAVGIEFGLGEGCLLYTSRCV